MVQCCGGGSFEVWCKHLTPPLLRSDQRRILRVVQSHVALVLILRIPIFWDLAEAENEFGTLGLNDPGASLLARARRLKSIDKLIGISTKEPSERKLLSSGNFI